MNLQQHLTHVHSVAQDCVDKLISTVSVCKCVFVVFAFVRKQKENEKGKRWGMGESEM